jgi:hypothetical protein
MTNNPLPSKISGNVRLFVFYKNMYFILFYVKHRAQRKLPGPPKRCNIQEFDIFDAEGWETIYPLEI